MANFIALFQLLECSALCKKIKRNFALINFDGYNLFLRYFFMCFIFSEISRGCMPSNRIIPKCKTDIDNDIYGTFCACNEDFCNHVNSVYDFSFCTSFTILFIILNLLTWFFYFFVLSVFIVTCKSVIGSYLNCKHFLVWFYVASTLLKSCGYFSAFTSGAGAWVEPPTFR